MKRRYCLMLLMCLAGCGNTASLDLLTVARTAIADARTDLANDREDRIENMAFIVENLDAAFDSDVRLVAAGAVMDSDGNPVEITPDWVISARQGYGVARNALTDQMLTDERNYMIRQDNLVAADEAIARAQALMLQWSGLNDDVQSSLIEAQEIIIHDD